MPRVRSALVNSVWLVAVAVSAVSFAVLAEPEGAIAVGGSSTIRTYLRDSLPPALSLMSPINGATVQDTSVVVEGSVHNMSQLMIYLDGAYYMTVPLDAGAESFAVTLVATVGPHAIRIVGIDAVTDTQIEVTTEITCTAPPVVNEVVNNVVGQVGGAVISAGQEIKSQVDQASGWGPMKSLTDTLYNALRTLDIMPTSSTESIPAAVGRVALISAGVTLAVAPGSASFMLSRLRLIPRNAILSPHVTARLHVVGAILFVIPFVFMQ